MAKKKVKKQEEKTYTKQDVEGILDFLKLDFDIELRKNVWAQAYSDGISIANLTLERLVKNEKEKL